MTPRGIAIGIAAVLVGLYATGNDPLVVAASAVLGGYVVHEMAHFTVAALAGRRPRFEVDREGMPVAVAWETAAGPTLRDDLALAAPILLGVCVGLAAAVAGSIPGWAVTGWLLLFAGTREDWEGARALAGRVVFLAAFAGAVVAVAGRRTLSVVRTRE